MQPLPEAPAVDPGLLGELVAVAFSQRRKLLRHTLGRWLELRGFAGTFNVQRRAEEVPVAEYLQLAEAFSALKRRPAGRLFSCQRGLCRVEPHRRVERAAHQRHVHAEARVRRALRRRLGRLFRDALGHFRRPLP
jgi:hypothetical protein